MAKTRSSNLRAIWRRYRGITILLLLALTAELVFLIRSGMKNQSESNPNTPGYAATATFGAPEESEEESEEESTTDPDEELSSHVETEAEILARLPEKLQLLYSRNSDTHDFVFGYEENHDQDFEIDLSEYANCTEVPLLLQWDKRWGYKEYAGEMFGLSGCGPTCLSMCAIYLTGNPEYSPEYMRQFSIENDYYVDGSGSKWLLIMEGPELLGIDVTEIPVYEDRVIENLEVGNPIISIVGPGVFTTTGHFIVLAGVDEDGNIIVNDPNSITRSSQTWQFSEFADQIEAMWVLR